MGPCPCRMFISRERSTEEGTLVLSLDPRPQARVQRLNVGAWMQRSIRVVRQAESQCCCDLGLGPRGKQVPFLLGVLPPSLWEVLSGWQP